MIITVPGKDLITITDNDISDSDIKDWNVNPSKKKIHLVKVQISEPTEEKLDFILANYPTTNRFIINDNIKFYNWIFKKNEKKYYVSNNYNTRIISFFKKNNKVLLNFNNLDNETRSFVLKERIFKDILRNLEIIQLDEHEFLKKKPILLNWNGNVIIA